LSNDQQEVIELCQSLVRIQSYNPPGNEREIAEFIAGFLQNAGLRVELVKHDPRRASVLAILNGTGKQPGLLYSAHMDTVPVGAQAWEHAPFSGDIADGKLWGRGSADMKGGAAAIMMAAKNMAKPGKSLKGNLVLAFSADEEVGLTGASEMAKNPYMEGLGAVLVAEPTSNDLVIAEKGSLWLEITTQGKTAHGSMPHMGINAISMMRQLLDELEKMPVQFETHPLLGNFTISINTLSGGFKTNVVPDLCIATVDMRTVPGQDNQAIYRQVLDLATDLEKHIPGFRAEIKTINPSSPPLYTPSSHPIVLQFASVLHEITGTQPDMKGVSYYSDAGIYVPELHLPMIICGPGAAELAHQPNEYVEIDKLLEAAQIYTQAATRFLI
jgi:succinyl-diaminopimelate desuccinylase